MPVFIDERLELMTGTVECVGRARSSGDAGKEGWYGIRFCWDSTV